MPTYPFTLIDVFAERPLEGNLLAVIDDADTLDDVTMATIARRMRLSETSFIQTSTSQTADYRHRIFVVEGEIPFAGHPSLGTAAVWARRQGADSAEYVQQTISGEQRLKVELRESSGNVTIWQNAASFGEIIDGSPILEALGLTTGDRHLVLRPQVMSTGLPTLVVPIDDTERLGAILMDTSRLAEAMPVLDDGSKPLTCYVVAEEAAGEWRARSFGADLAGGEDPATGSAAGAFGAYLAQYLGIHRFAIRQGIEMGCPSRLYVDTTAGITVNGEVQFVGAGMLDLP